MRQFLCIISCLLFAGCGYHKKENKKIIKKSFVKKDFAPLHKNKKIASVKFDPTKTAYNIYGKNGANIALEQIIFIKKLMTSIKKLSIKKQHQVAYCAADIIQKELPSTSKSQRPFYAHAYDQLIKKSHIQSEQKKYSQEIYNVAQDILKYIKIEQDYIFTHPKKTALFFAAQQTNHLPSLLSFWVSKTGEKILKTQLNFPSDQVKTQNMLLSMGVMVGTQMGATSDNTIISQTALGVTNEMTKEEKAAQTNVKAFQTLAQSRQSSSLSKRMTVFSNQEQAAQADVAQAKADASIEREYIFKAISIQAPQQDYLFGQVQFDQLFELSPMTTPSSMTWHNPFPVGDWEYDSDNNSFWQNQISSIFQTKKATDGTTSQDSSQAINNSIFTEYYTTKASYTITGEISLYKIEYPFVAGIMFNKSRWISGNYEALRKSRMVGIYGKTSSDIGVYFSEQYTMTADQLATKKSTQPLQEPLPQILDKTAKKLKTIKGSTFDNIGLAPVVFNFKITTSPTSASCKIWQSHQKEPKSGIAISNLDLHLYLYHGIGFVAPGAIAEFKITSPTDLTFSTQEIEKYKESEAS